MTKPTLRLLALSLALPALAAGCGGVDKARTARLASATGDAEAAGPVYAANCAGCHGADGTGKKGSPNLMGEHVRGMSREKLARVILGGDGPMPGFADKLDDGQIANLIAWIKRGPSQE